jgi:hypothetical protein
MRDMGRLDVEWAARRWRSWSADETIKPLRFAREMEELGLVDEAIEACRAAVGQQDHAESALLTLYDRYRGDEDSRRDLTAT